MNLEQKLNSLLRLCFSYTTWHGRRIIFRIKLIIDQNYLNKNGRNLRTLFGKQNLVPKSEKYHVIGTREQSELTENSNESHEILK